MIDWLKKRLTLSVAAIAAISSGLFLLVVAVGVGWVYSMDPARVAWGDYVTVRRAFVLAVLWLASCFLIYWSVRCWLDDTPIGHAGVRNAWRACWEMLHRRGQTIHSIPCYVVLGSNECHSLTNELDQDGEADMPSIEPEHRSVRWRLRREGLFASLVDIGLHSESSIRRSSAGSADKHGLNPVSIETSRDENTGSASHDTGDNDGSKPDSSASDETAGAAAHHETNSHETNSGETKGGETGAVEGPDSSAAPSGSDEPANDAVVGGETSVDGNIALAPTKTAVKALPKTETQSGPVGDYDSQVTRSLEMIEMADRLVKQVLDDDSEEAMFFAPNEISEIDSVETEKRQSGLVEFCQRLRSDRYPHSPVNGAVICLTSNQLQTSQASLLTIGRRIRGDLAVLENELGVLPPITFVVDHACSIGETTDHSHGAGLPGQPLGRIVDPSQVLSPTGLKGIADGTIEETAKTVRQLTAERSLAVSDWNESILRNRRDIQFLLNCRQWRTPLKTVLTEALSGPDAQLQEARLSGLFLSVADPSPSTGLKQTSNETQTTLGSNWISSIFARLCEHQNFVQWRDEVTESERRAEKTVFVMKLVFGLLVVVCFVQLLF